MSGQQDGRDDEGREQRSGNGRTGKAGRPGGQGGKPRGSSRDRRAGAPKGGRAGGRPRGESRDDRAKGTGAPRSDRDRNETKRQGSWSPSGRKAGGAPGARRSGPGTPSAAGGRRDDDKRRTKPSRSEGEPSRNRDTQRRDKQGGRGDRSFDERRRDGRGQGAGGTTDGRRGGSRPWASRSETGGRRDERSDTDRNRDRSGTGRRPDDRRGPGARGGPRRERFAQGPGDRGPRSDDRAGGPRERSSTVRKIADGRQRTDRPADPPLPADVTGEELDAEAREELRALPKDLATIVGRHLVMAGRLVDEDTEQAYLHAKTARRLASRVGIVREGSGLAAYHTGRWAEALAELRAARRLSGREAYLPILADCERGLDRPERALSLARSAEAERLDQADRVELRIVESGARRDMEQYDAAVVTLQIPELKDRRLRPWSARLFYAYADALSAAGREDEARDWFARAAAADRDGDTDAAERYAELEGLEIVDTEEDVDYPAEEPENDTGESAETAKADED